MAKANAERARILLLDDDPAALRFLEFKLRRTLPEVDFESRLEPQVDGDFDIYFIDNEFDGKRMAAQLADRIRSQQPTAVIVAYSATLDRATLKSLLRAGCTKACDKSDPAELDEALQAICERVRAASALRPKSKGPFGSLTRGLRTIVELLEAWNTRLRQNEWLSHHPPNHPETDEPETTTPPPSSSSESDPDPSMNEMDEPIRQSA